MVEPISYMENITWMGGKTGSMIRFWLQKIQFMCYFAAHRDWALVRAEWKLTKKDLDEAKARSEEINREATERLLEALREK